MQPWLPGAGGQAGFWPGASRQVLWRKTWTPTVGRAIRGEATVSNQKRSCMVRGHWVFRRGVNIWDVPGKVGFDKWRPRGWRRGRKGPSRKEKVSKGRSQEGRGEEERVWLRQEQGPSQRVGAEKAGKRVKAMQCWAWKLKDSYGSGHARGWRLRSSSPCPVGSPAGTLEHRVQTKDTTCSTTVTLGHVIEPQSFHLGNGDTRECISFFFFFSIIFSLFGCSGS